MYNDFHDLAEHSFISRILRDQHTGKLLKNAGSDFFSVLPTWR